MGSASQEGREYSVEVYRSIDDSATWLSVLRVYQLKKEMVK